jgi:hypothetical protein
VAAICLRLPAHFFSDAFLEYGEGESRIGKHPTFFRAIRVGLVKLFWLRRCEEISCQSQEYYLIPEILR